MGKNVYTVCKVLERTLNDDIMRTNKPVQPETPRLPRTCVHRLNSQPLLCTSHKLRSVSYFLSIHKLHFILTINTGLDLPTKCNGAPKKCFL